MKDRDGRTQSRQAGLAPPSKDAAEHSGDGPTTDHRVPDTDTLARLFQVLMDGLPDSIYFKDTRSRFTMVNRRKAEKSGVDDPVDLVGKTDFDLFSEEHAGQAFEDEREVMRTGVPLIGKEERETWPDGSETWVSTTKMPLYDGQGDVAGTFGISRDITQRKRAEAEIRKREARFRALVELAPDIIFRLGPDGNIEFVSGAVRVYGYEPHDLLGKSFEDFFHPDDLPKALRGFVEQRTGSRATRDFEVRLRTRKPRRGDGDYIHALVSARGIWDVPDKHIKRSAKTFLGTQGIIHDVTEQRRVAEALRESEQKFRSLVETTSDWIWVLDARGVYTYASPKVKDLLGYEPSEVMGKEPFSFMPEAEALRLRAVFADIAGARRAFTGLENVNLHKDGREVVLESSGVPIFDGSGVFQGYRGIDRDITDRRRAEEELRKHRDHLEDLVQARTRELEDANRQLEREVRERRQAEKEIRRFQERLSGIFNSSKDAIGFFSVDGILQDVNEATCDLTGYSRDELLTGKKYQDLTPSEYHDYEARITAEILQSGIPAEYEKEYIRKDGTRVPILSTTFVVRGDDGKPIGLASIVKDITERKWAERALRESERLEAVSALAGGVAHNFNNTISLISGLASSIAESLLPGTLGQRDAMKILDAARHAGELTRRLVRVAKASPSGGEVRLSDVSLQDVVQDTVELVAPNLAEKNIRIDVHHPERMPYVRGDANQLLDVLMNMFINASEAMPEGGTITVDCVDRRLPRKREAGRGTGESYTALRIRDNGQGMSKDIRESIFDAFFTTKKEKGAFGLGLSVAQSMVRGMGGWIDVRSKQGSGSTFRIFLEKTASKPADVPVDESVAEQTILLVDDKDDVLAMMTRALETAGHKVYAADNAAEALDLYGQHKTDIGVCVVDGLLPGKDGKAMLKTVLEDASGTGAILTSGFSRDHLRQRLKWGAWTFLQKPFTADQLVETVQDVALRTSGRRKA